MGDVYRFFGSGSRRTERVRVGHKTFKFSDSFLETFDFGWSKATTFDRYMGQVRAMLTLARGDHDAESVVAQACLQAAIVFLVSGLENLLATVLHERTGSATLPDQALAEYERLLGSFPEYARLDEPNRAAVDRLFKVRHVVVHAGVLCSEKSSRAAQRSKSRGAPLVFDIDDVDRVAQACDDLADRIEKCRTATP